MRHLLFPTEKNNYKANILKPKFIYLFTLIIIIVNSISPLFTFAVNSDISRENLLEKHNEQRAQLGLPLLKINEELNQSAQKKAEQMIASNCWSHYCPDGQSPWNFFLESGYDYYFAGENLAEGFTTIDRVMLAWINSPTHRDNIIKSHFEDIGFGITSGPFQGKDNNIVIVVHFGKELAETTQPIVKIDVPKNGDVFITNSVDLLGKAKDVTSVELYVNDTEYGSLFVDGGIFTTRIQDLSKGTNNVTVVAGGSGASDSVSIIVQDNVVQNAIVVQTSSGIVNLILLFIIILVLGVDFYYVITTKVVRQKQDMQHYHFGLFLILFIMIFTTDIYSNIGNSISI
jgi:hypothetical protein